MSNIIEDVLHELIDVASGVQAHLAVAHAAELHDAITPGYTDVPVTEAEAAAAQSVLDRLQREADAKAAATSAPAAEPEVEQV